MVEVVEVVEVNAVSVVSQSVVKPPELCGQATVPKLDAQHSVEKSLAATEVDVTPVGSAPVDITEGQLQQRTQRANAGSRLKGILQEEKRRVEDVESEETDEREVDTKDTVSPLDRVSLLYNASPPSPSVVLSALLGFLLGMLW